MTSGSDVRPVRFLLVEDDEDHAELVRSVLDDHRVANTLDHVWDGEEAVRFLKREGEFSEAKRPDVVLLDLKLPRMDGHEVLDIVKNDPELLSIPIVMLTTSDAEGDRLQAYQRHVNSYLIKPIDFQQFSELVKMLDLYWAVWNAPPPA